MPLQEEVKTTKPFFPTPNDKEVGNRLCPNCPHPEHVHASAAGTAGGSGKPTSGRIQPSRCALCDCQGFPAEPVDIAKARRRLKQTTTEQLPGTEEGYVQRRGKPLDTSA